MLLLDDTQFFQSRRFKWLRYLVAASVVSFYFGKSLYHLLIQIPYIFQNGPFARNASFAFGLDDLVIVLLWASILVSELEIVAKPKTYHLLRTVCIILGVSTIFASYFFIREIAHMLDFDYFELGIAAHVMKQVITFFAVIYLYNRITIHRPEVEVTNA